MMPLADHLARYGIRHFENEEYWAWAQERLGPAEARELDFLRETAASPGARRRPEKLRRFYDRIAEPHFAGVVQSMKAQAILKSGEAAARILAGRKNILDVGCGGGYLTTWYALADPSRRVTGIDFSSAAIAAAVRKSRELGISNASFFVREASSRIAAGSGPYDAVVETQAVQWSAPLDAALQAVKGQLAPEGIFVSVPALETARHGKAFVNSLERAGFSVVSLEFIYYRDCGIPGAYPVIVCDVPVAGTVSSRKPVNLEAEFEQAWQNLNRTGKEMARE